jgi:hypothetical protein
MKQAGKADEGRPIGDLDGPEAEAVGFEVRQVARDAGGGLLARERRGKKLHDARVGIHLGERIEVALPPRAEQQPGRADLGRWRHRARHHDIESAPSPSPPRAGRQGRPPPGARFVEVWVRGTACGTP